MDLFAPGRSIEQRLRQKCPSAKAGIFSSADLQDVKESGQKTPALYVVLHSYKKADEAAGDGLWDVTWLVVAVDKNVRQGDQAAVRDKAGPMLSEAIAAIDGWHCPGVVGPVLSTTPPLPLITDGFGYFPLAFVTRVVTDGAQYEDY